MHLSSTYTIEKSRIMVINKHVRLFASLSRSKVSQRRCRNQGVPSERCAMRHSENANGAAFRLTPCDNRASIWAKVIERRHEKYAEACITRFILCSIALAHSMSAELLHKPSQNYHPLVCGACRETILVDQHAAEI